MAIVSVKMSGRRELNRMKSTRRKFTRTGGRRDDFVPSSYSVPPGARCAWSYGPVAPRFFFPPFTDKMQPYQRKGQLTSSQSARMNR